jgi:site-specific DNA recombinase
MAGCGGVGTGIGTTAGRRTRAWPVAVRLLRAGVDRGLADPGRGWDAIVIGEYERAFYGSQYALIAPLFEHYGIQLWMPEAGGGLGHQAG